MAPERHGVIAVHRTTWRDNLRNVASVFGASLIDEQYPPGMHPVSVPLPHRRVAQTL